MLWLCLALTPSSFSARYWLASCARRWPVQLGPQGPCLLLHPRHRTTTNTTIKNTHTRALRHSQQCLSHSQQSPNYSSLRRERQWGFQPVPLQPD